WVVTGWPGGSGAIQFSAISILLLGTMGDSAYGAALLFMVGVILDLVITAIVKFAALPGFDPETFIGFSLVLAPCLVPIGALLAQASKPWQVALFTGMTIAFMPILSPIDPITYNPSSFYNNALTVIGGNVAAAFSFSFFPPLSPGFRARRLLALTLRDLRRLAAKGAYRDWFGRCQARLVALPDAATSLQRAQLLAALSVGSDLLQLRD